MKVIAFASQKGGSGKSTLAAHLSILADDPPGSCMLIDADPQASLTFWWDLREAKTPYMVAKPAQQLAQVIEGARNKGIETVIIDGPPHNRADIANIIRHSNLVVVPTRPAIFDVAAVKKTINLVAAVQRPHLVVLNACPPRRWGLEASATTDARKAVKNMGAPVWSGSIVNRAALAYAFTVGQGITEFEPHSSGSKEMRKLWAQVQKTLEGLELR